MNICGYLCTPQPKGSQYMNVQPGAGDIEN